MDIEYLKGKENVIADALSRVSPQQVRESKVDRDVIPVHMLTEEIPADKASIVGRIATHYLWTTGPTEKRSVQRMAYCSRVTG